MRRTVALLLTAFLALLICLPTLGQGAKRPRDFAVQYDFRNGTVAPPYHYAYTIAIAASGRGSIVMVPGYVSAKNPKWSEVFTLSPTQRDHLYEALSRNGLFATHWQKEKMRRVGGSSQELTVTANRRGFTLEDYVVENQSKSAQAIYAAIQNAVPKAIMDRLEAKRAKYVAQKKGKR